MTILVTGAAGFIGSSLTETLLARGDRVVGIDNFTDYYSPARKRANIAPFLNNHNFKLAQGDFRDRDFVESVFKTYQPQRVAHLGAMGSVRYSVKHPHLYTDVNIVGTNNVLDAAHRYGVSQFVFASTSSIYGQTAKVPFVESDPTDSPLAPYPATKKASEVMGHAYFNMHGLNFTALRFFNVYGPKGRPDMMPYIILERLVKQETITWFDNGQMKRDWTYIDDIISGVVAALDTPLGYQIINLGRGEPVLMQDFLALAETISDTKAILNVVDAPPSEPKITYANAEKAHKLLNYHPKTSVEQGLSQFWDWYQHHVIRR